jgi:prolyl 4-hydroxylase
MANIAPGIYTVFDYLSPAECAACIMDSEACRYEEATIVTRKGAILDTAVRNNARVIRDDQTFADFLWQRLREHLPAFIDGRQAVGLNERFRFYRYEPGQYFAGHTDGPFRRESGQLSLLTFMVYLNDDFEGGETAFPDLVVSPRRGMALVFRHELFHEGRPVAHGKKYVLRSDVMFNPIGQLSG